MREGSGGGGGGVESAEGATDGVESEREGGGGVKR